MRFDNEWYVVAEGREISGDRPVRVSLFGDAIVLFRTRDGSLQALHDRCPHMGASLALGRVIDDKLACPLHAFEFDARGECVRIPQRKDATRTPKGMCTARFEVRERDGWVFLFWGRPEDVCEEPEYLTEVEAPGFSHASSTHVWQQHFSRVIENQLDSAHVKQVHRATIGRFLPELVDKRIEVHGRVIKGRNAANGYDPQYTKLLYPNIWINRINERMIAMVAIVPVDDSTSKIYLRTYQAFVKAPALRSFVAWTMHLLSKRVLSEDQEIASSQLPRDTLDVRERMLEFDNMIAAYRRLRKQRARAQPSVAPIASDIRELEPQPTFDRREDAVG